MGLRACWQARAGDAQSTTCDTLSLARALYFAAGKRPNVINLSLSGPDTRLLRALVAADEGSWLDSRRRLRSQSRRTADFRHPSLALSLFQTAPWQACTGQVYIAPGQDVPTTEPGGRWFLVNGSSFAAAHVSGLFALMRERRARCLSADRRISQRHDRRLRDGGAAIGHLRLLVRPLPPRERENSAR